MHTYVSLNDINDYADRCKRLNRIIDNEPSLGNNYEICHTFLSEIIAIYHQILTSYNKRSMTDARRILWAISIRPTLEAYCGSMGKEFERKFINDCDSAFNN